MYIEHVHFKLLTTFQEIPLLKQSNETLVYERNRKQNILWKQAWTVLDLVVTTK